MCNSSTGDYCVYELSILLRWHYEWRNVDEWDVSGTSSTVPGSVLRIPNLERTQRRHRFTLVLELADENSPDYDISNGKRTEGKPLVRET